MIQGLVSGQIIGRQGSYEKELDRAIKAAKDKGANIFRDDFVFSNWDLTEDYIEAEYKTAKK